jgi:hypothetical protein
VLRALFEGASSLKDAAPTEEVSLDELEVNALQPADRPEPSSGHKGWRMGARDGLLASHVANALVRLETEMPLSFEGVSLDVEVQDLPPTAETPPAVHSYRAFLIRPLCWPTLELRDHRCWRPKGWRSEPLTLYRENASVVHSRLGDFEAEFAVRAFLKRVEKDIRSACRRAADHEGTRRRRQVCGDPQLVTS